jgi:hypothetical protein
MDARKDAYVIKMTTPVRHARKIFFGAILLCALLVFNVAFLKEAPSWHQAGVRPFMGPLLYWSLAAAAHAFYILVRMACRLTKTVQDLFAVDRTRAVRLVTESESWARWWAPDDPA